MFSSFANIRGASASLACIIGLVVRVPNGANRLTCPATAACSRPYRQNVALYLSRGEYSGEISGVNSGVISGVISFFDSFASDATLILLDTGAISGGTMQVVTRW